MTPKEVMELLVAYELMDLTTIQYPNKGLLSLSRPGKIASQHPGDRTFEDLNIPLWVALSNLNKGKVEYHNKYSLVEKVLASASIPLLFSPVDIDSYTYVEGGLFDNLPVNPIKEQSKQIIGVDISPVDEIREFGNILDIEAWTFQLNDKSNTRKNSKLCSIYIEPRDLCKHGLLDTLNTDELFDIGYRYTVGLDF